MKRIIGIDKILWIGILHFLGVFLLVSFQIETIMPWSFIPCCSSGFSFAILYTIISLGVRLLFSQGPCPCSFYFMILRILYFLSFCVVYEHFMY